MNKKEEKKLINLIQKEVKKNEKIFGHPIMTVSVVEKIINFVIEHDKRERDRLIKEIEKIFRREETIYQIQLDNVKNTRDRGIIVSMKSGSEDLIKQLKEIINKYK